MACIVEGLQALSIHRGVRGLCNAFENIRNGEGGVVARRTKEDAEATRHALLDAAEIVFYECGVSGASLADVAKQAGLTRGAIYWHFKGKLDLFEAMMQRVTLPLEQVFATQTQAQDTQLPPLERVLTNLELVFRVISTDTRARRVFEIAMIKVAHVGELAAVRQRWIAGSDRFVALMAKDLALALNDVAGCPRISAHLAAKGLHAMFDGLLYAWVLRGGAFALEEEGMQLARFYLQGLGLSCK